LLAYNERLRIDGAEAEDAALVAGFEAVDGARGDVPLTYFEYGTLASLWLMQRARLDLAVLEVGLGGRLDAVNLIDADVAVITTVDLDHRDWLGDDREAIGAEKVGIARGGKPLILGEDDPPASVLSRAYAVGASALRAGCDFFFKTTSAASWRWWEVGFALDLPLPRLAAPVQLRNAATAIAAVRGLNKRLPRSAFAAGIVAADIPARWQRFDRGGVEVVVDVAHNPQAAQALAMALQTMPSTGRTLAVFAALGDKDMAGIVAPLADTVDDWLLAGLDTAGPRGLAIGDFMRRLGGTAAGVGHPFPTVEAALQAALRRATAGDRVLVFGSFHTAAAAMQVLQAQG
jgi:dihydrofolate synthase / folylpolyglutamate synthase